MLLNEVSRTAATTCGWCIGLQSPDAEACSRMSHRTTFHTLTQGSSPISSSQQLQQPATYQGLSSFELHQQLQPYNGRAEQQAKHLQVQNIFSALMELNGTAQSSKPSADKRKEIADSLGVSFHPSEHPKTRMRVKEGACHGSIKVLYNEGTCLDTWSFGRDVNGKAPHWQ